MKILIFITFLYVCGVIAVFFEGARCEYYNSGKLSAEGLVHNFIFSLCWPFILIIGMAFCFSDWLEDKIIAYKTKHKKIV